MLEFFSCWKIIFYIRIFLLRYGQMIFVLQMVSCVYITLNPRAVCSNFQMIERQLSQIGAQDCSVGLFRFILEAALFPSDNWVFNDKKKTLLITLNRCFAVTAPSINKVT